MFRIHFDPVNGLFCVQVLMLGFIWRTVHNTQREPYGFATYEDARKWCRGIGLTEAYAEQQSPKQRAAYLGNGLYDARQA